MISVNENKDMQCMMYYEYSQNFFIFCNVEVNILKHLELILSELEAR